MSGNGGEASACRFPLSPVSQPCHLLLTPFESGLRGSPPTLEVIMPSIRTTGTSTAPAPITTTAASGTAQHLLAELQHAETIIKTMLGAMTVQQKIKVGAQLEAAGVAGEGMTRYHERRAVIEAANAVTPSSATGTSRHLLSMMPVTSDPAPLTVDQLRIAQLYATMDVERQCYLMAHAADIAQLFPLRRAKPALHLVAGGVK
jgi:hypothetical protein